MSVQTREEKLAPHAFKAESALLGALLYNPQPYPAIRNRLAPDEFYDFSHRAIYEAMGECLTLGDAIDPLSVTERLEAHQQLKDIGGAAFVVSKLAGVPVIDNAETYANLIKRLAWRRRAIQFAGSIARLAHSEETSITEIHRQIIDGANNLSSGTVKGARTSRQMADEFTEAVMDAIQNGTKRQSWNSGFDLLNKLLAGTYRPGSFTVFCAYTNQGKTQIACEMAIAAARQGPTLYVTLESSPDTIFYRLIAKLSGVPASQIADFDLADGADSGAAMNAAGELGFLPLEVQTLENIEDIEAYIADMSIRYDFAPGMVFIDDIDSLADLQHGENGYSKLREISTRLLRLGLRTGWGVVGLKQLLMPTEAKGVTNSQKLLDLLTPTIMSIEGGRTLSQKGGNIISMLSHEWIVNKVYTKFQHEALRPGYVYFRKLKARDARSNGVMEVPLRFNADVPRFENAGGLHP